MEFKIKETELGYLITYKQIEVKLIFETDNVGGIYLRGGDNYKSIYIDKDIIKEEGIAKQLKQIEDFLEICFDDSFTESERIKVSDKFLRLFVDVMFNLGNNVDYFIKRNYLKEGENLYTFKEIVLFLSKEDSIIGDLCIDLLSDKNFNWDWDDEAKYEYLNALIFRHGHHLDEPIRRLKTIWQTIKRAR